MTVVSAVDGMGGVGKTALVVHAARRAHERGWFPGGVLFEDLRGYSTDDPVDHGVTAARLLRALGMPDRDVPVASQDRVLAWRDRLVRLGEQQRPLLVVLDNAVNAGQVSPLLPSPPHRMLVTSRNTLSTLAAHRVVVKPFLPDEAVQFLDSALRTARPDDDRVSADPAEARHLAELCGYLPLALRIVVALLRDEPDRPLADQAAELADARTRISRLRYDDVDEQGQPFAIEAAFDLSYRYLAADPECARAFRLLAWIPGSDTSTRAAAAAFDRPVADARRLLAAVARIHLLDKRSGERWGMHDLVRLYADQRARDHANEDRCQEVFDRLFNHYHSTLSVAGAWLRSYRAARLVHPGDFESRKQAVAWLDAEYPNLIAAVAAAHESQRWDQTYELAVRLTDYLEFRHRADDSITVGTLGLAAARHLGQTEECSAAMQLGTAHRIARQYEEAIDHLKNALDLAPEDDDRITEGRILHNLGLAYFRSERFADAESCHSRDLEICQNARDWRGAGEAMVALGDALRGLKRFREAVATLNRAIEVFELVGDLRNLLNARVNLALTCLDGFHSTRAAYIIWQLCLALKAARDLDDRYGQAKIFLILGGAYLNRCRGCHSRSAVEWIQQAATTFHELFDGFNEALALLNLGRAQLFIGMIADARRNLSRAATTCDKLGESSYAEEARALLADTADTAEGTVPPHTGCPDDGHSDSDIRRAWLDDLPHAVLRRADSRLDEARFVGNLMIGPTPDGSVLPDELLTQNDLGLFVDGKDLTEDESLRFLRDHAPLDNDQGAREIAAEIGNNPDALALAAAVVRRERLTSTAFLERLRKISLDGSSSLRSPRPHSSGAARAALLALESIERDDPRTSTLLDLIGLLSTAPVDRRLIQRAFSPDNAAEIDATLAALTDASVLSSNDHDTIIMNPIVEHAVRYRAARRGTLLAAATKATRLLLNEVTAFEGKLVDKAKLDSFTRQIDTLWAAVRPELPGSEWAATVDMMRLRAWQVNLFTSAGQCAKAIELGDCLLNDCQQMLGTNHQETWRARNNLAGAHSTAGDHDHACAFLSQTLRLIEGSADHPDTLLIRHTLGVIHLHAGRPKRAVRILEDVLADRERALGVDHPDTLETCHWLGVARGEIGDIAEAMRLLEQTLNDRRNLVEPGLLGLIATLDALADLYVKSGRSDDALTTRNESLTHRERIFPAGHITVITARSALGDSNVEAGRFDEATRLLKRNLVEIERVHHSEERIIHVARQQLEDVQRKAKKRRR